MATTFNDRLARLEQDRFADSPIQSGQRRRPVHERRTTSAPHPWIAYYFKGLLFSAIVGLVVLVIDAFKGNGSMRQDMFVNGWWPMAVLGMLILALPMSFKLRKQAAERANSNLSPSEWKARERRTGRLLALRFAFPWFFLMPWWLFMALGILFAVGAQIGYNSSYVDQQVGAARAMRPAPPSVDLSEFDPAHDTWPLDEVHVRGWINPDYNYQLQKVTASGRVRKMRYMHVLFGKADDTTATEVRAVILLQEDERGQVRDWLDAHMVGLRRQGPIFEINGFTGNTQGFSTQMEDAFEREGLVKADTFVIIEPFLEGREAALRNVANPMLVLVITSGLALLSFAISIVKLRAWRRRRAVRLRARAA